MTETAISPGLEKLLKKQQYRLAGSHSAVKICTWTKKALLDEGSCYKQRFYGIKSHRCLQMTPWLDCGNRCLYCWRAVEQVLLKNPGIDEPKEIIDACVRSQRKLLTGFKGNDRVNMKKWDEAQRPNQAAISLAGEPTLYPRISGLIEGFRKKSFSTFLVTNGQYPGRLEGLAEPTSLYISLDAPDREAYKKVDRPTLKDFWERLNRSLELMSSFNCRKVIRMTMVNGLNMANPEGYAKLIEKASPDFIEVKGYMWLGFSRNRLKEVNMPTHDEVKEFAKKITERTGYSFKDEQPESRVVLLSKG